MKMRLGKMFPKVFKKLKKDLKDRDKAIETEMAYREYERTMGQRPKFTMIDGINRTLKVLGRG
jgi:hypothetical protein